MIYNLRCLVWFSGKLTSFVSLTPLVFSWLHHVHTQKEEDKATLVCVWGASVACSYKSCLKFKGIVHPKMKICCHITGRPRYRWDFFFSRTVKKFFKWNRCPYCQFIHCTMCISVAAGLRVNKTFTDKTKLIFIALMIHWGLIEDFIEHKRPVA